MVGASGPTVALVFMATPGGTARSTTGQDPVSWTSANKTPVQTSWKAGKNCYLDMKKAEDIS